MEYEATFEIENREDIDNIKAMGHATNPSNGLVYKVTSVVDPVPPELSPWTIHGALDTDIIESVVCHKSGTFDVEYVGGRVGHGYGDQGDADELADRAGLDPQPVPGNSYRRVRDPADWGTPL
jgi:hypothetical protein